MTNLITNVDLSQAELRVMAILSEDEWMIKALQEGEGDFFNNHLMPVAFPWIEETYYTIAEFERQQPIQHKELRTKVKGVQYGLAFGRTARAIGKALDMSHQEAQTIITNYFDTAPGFARWRRDVMEAAINPAKRDLLVSPTGRRFQSEVVTTKNQNAIQREALAFLPQSSSSDICIMSAMQVSQMLKEAGAKTRVINLVHDAVMFEGPEEEAEEVGSLTGTMMRVVGETLMGDAVPFLSEFSSAKSWSDLS